MFEQVWIHLSDTLPHLELPKTLDATSVKALYIVINKPSTLLELREDIALPLIYHLMISH